MLSRFLYSDLHNSKQQLFPPPIGNSVTSPHTKLSAHRAVFENAEETVTAPIPSQQGPHRHLHYEKDTNATQMTSL